MEDRTDEVIEILSTSHGLPTDLLSGGYVNYARLFSECKLLSWYSLNWAPAAPTVPIVGMIMMAIEKSVYISFSPRYAWVIDILDPFNPRELALLMWMLKHHVSHVGRLVIKRLVECGYDDKMLLKMCVDEVAAGNNRGIKYAVMSALFDELIHPSPTGNRIVDMTTPVLVKCGESIDWDLEMIRRETAMSARDVNVYEAKVIISFIILHVLSIADIIALFDILLRDAWPKKIILFVASCLEEVLDEKTAVLTMPSPPHSHIDVYTAIAYYYPAVMRMMRSRRDILDAPIEDSLISCHHRLQYRGIRTIGDILDRGIVLHRSYMADIIIIAVDE